MKINKETTFPMTLQFTFENKEELEVFKLRMLGHFRGVSFEVASRYDSNIPPLSIIPDYRYDYTTRQAIESLTGTLKQGRPDLLDAADRELIKLFWEEMKA